MQAGASQRASWWTLAVGAGRATGGRGGRACLQ